jgi:Uncharacterised MFS-type transporter YbfB
MVALAVAMGIGRFAFTPLLPMMLADGVIDLPTASWLASANYIGYMLGALLCTFQPWIWRVLGRSAPIRPAALVRAGLAATVLLTLAMAAPLPLAWPTLRFAAGVASALVFVYTSGWCLGRLADLGQPALGGAIYVGPGGGIVASGLLATAMVSLHWSAASGWVLFSGLALVLTAVVWNVFSGGAAPAVAGTPVPSGVRAGRAHGRGEMGMLAAAYGLAGFGYIITATFLPVIARAALPGSIWLDLFWPLLGCGVMAGALLATRFPVTSDLRLLLAGCYFVQAVGIAAPAVWQTLAGFAAGSVLLGVPFTAITYFAMQEVRRLRPDAVASTIGLMTVTYGAGQIVGPLLVAALLHSSASTASGFTLALEIASGSLIVGALCFVWLSRRYPLRSAEPAPRKQVQT